MEDVKPKREPDTEQDDNLFEVICRHKDTNPSNLNEKFESYGMTTLEAKVPIIYDAENLEKLLSNNPGEQMYSCLSSKAKSASNAAEGRRPRTRNRQLKLIEVGNERVLAAGEIRERSPVDVEELDDDLEAYIKERDRILACKGDSDSPDASTSRQPSDTPESTSNACRTTGGRRRDFNKKNKEMPDGDCLNQDLDDYMREATRIREQKKRIATHSDQATIMMEMEEDFDNDKLD